MPTAEVVRGWVEDLRMEFPWFADPERAGEVWLDNAAMPLRTNRWVEPVRRASLDPRRLHDLLDAWCASVAEHLGVHSAAVLPTMGNHMTIERIVSLLDLRGPGRYLMTPDAHRAVMNPLELLYVKGRAEIVPVALDERGRVDLGDLADRLDAEVRGVFLTHVSSVTGTRQEVDAAQALIRAHRQQTGATTVLVVDGAQAVPRLPVDASGIDVYTISSQKAGGLPGSVVAVGDDGFRAMAPEATSVEDARFRVHGFLAGGTHHVGAIGALAEALDFLDGLPALDAAVKPGMPSVAAAIGLLRDRLIGRLKEVKGVEVLYEPEVPGENAGLVTFRVVGMPPAEVGAALAERHVHVRPAVKDVWGEYFHVPLVDRLLPEIDAWEGVLRASPWVTNVPEDVDRLAEALAEIISDGA